MLKERDWNILRHIEMYGAISLKNVSSLYFVGEYKTEEYRYRCAARRMQADIYPSPFNDFKTLVISPAVFSKSFLALPIVPSLYIG